MVSKRYWDWFHAYLKHINNKKTLSQIFIRNQSSLATKFNSYGVPQPEPFIANRVLFASFQTHKKVIAWCRSLFGIGDTHGIKVIIGELWVKFS